MPLDLSEEGDTPVHHINHFVTPQEKFRVVYNGALKIDRMSLNDMLHRGPMFIESLVGILLRLRQYACAVIGDIRNMFFQIGLDPKDREMLRFLPFTKGSSCNASNQWRFKVMPYGLICVPSIAGYCIKYTAKKNYSNASADTVERVKRDFHVDDFITSVPNVGHAQRVVKETIDLMETTEFVVTKFSSNCKEVLDGLDPDCLAPSLKNINLSKDGLPEQKTLGIAWDAEKDEIVARVSRSEQRAYSRLTRRLALTRLNSYFDPLGVWSPFFVALKLCYSRIVEDTTGWDDYVNTELTQEWNLLLDELAGLSSLSVPDSTLA